MNSTDLLKLLESGKAIVGADRTIKNLKTGKIAKVIVAKNVSKIMSEELKKYQDMSGVEIEKLEISNEEFGSLCKRRHPISVLGILK